MEQLSGLDASFLNMETPTTFPHVAHLVICEATTPEVRSFEHLCASIDSRLHLFPAYRRRIVEVPFGLDHPYWIEDVDFDLEYHIRHASLPGPGTDEQLADLVARIMGRPLDRRRPLWEMYLIDGLEDRVRPKFVRRYAEVGQACIEGVRAFAADVRDRQFPGPGETYTAGAELAAALELY